MFKKLTFRISKYIHIYIYIKLILKKANKLTPEY